jgi:regulator of PEP synthase PpsR (kinase-PPPase family)
MGKPARKVFFVSDRTGITVETLGRSLLSQFDAVAFDLSTIPFVDTPGEVNAVVARVNEEFTRTGLRPLVFSTMVDPGFRAALAQCDGLCLDFFASFLPVLQQELEVEARPVVGRTHGFPNPMDYDLRMETVNFALVTDDGVGAQHYEAADLVIVGVSRSGKTPTCLYMAMQFGVRAANYPLTEEDLEHGRLPAVLRPQRDKLFGLLIDPVRLHEIRSKRRPDSRYASISQCQYELRQMRRLLKREQIPYLDSSTMSVEEIATSILHTRGLARTVR